MQFIKNYSYPFFLSISGIMATLSDVLQNIVIAYCIISILIVAAAITFIAEYFRPLNKTITENLPAEIRSKFSNKPFAVSCLILAAIVGGFTTISARASTEGGVIASSFPEIRDLQVHLGILEETSARIEQKAERILDATRQWVSITDFRVWKNPDGNLVHVRLENNTPFLFKNLKGEIKTAANSSIRFGDLHLAADAIHWENFPSGNSTPETMTVCLIGERSKDNVHIREIRNYRVGKSDGTSFDYLLFDVKGPDIIAASEDCSA